MITKNSLIYRPLKGPFAKDIFNEQFRGYSEESLLEASFAFENFERFAPSQV